jgi:hypothetical protein
MSPLRGSRSITTILPKAHALGYLDFAAPRLSIHEQHDADQSAGLFRFQSPTGILKAKKKGEHT